MSSTGQVDESRGRRLDSWKSIAQYLGRDVRSVQRWEHERGLPVHRLPGDKNSAVFAYQNELDQWLCSGSSDTAAAADAAADALEPPGDGQSHPVRSSSLIPGASTIGWLAAGALGIMLAAVFVLYRPEQQLPSVPTPLPRSIAVLPMKNLSGDAAQDYFADGFTEELVTALTEIRSLRVISRTSTMVYQHSNKSLPEIARELHVSYILEGSVTREGQRVRVIAQLIDAKSDTHISARTYDADLKDVLDVQSRISQTIASDVRLDLSPQEKLRLASARPVDPVAHDLYLQASYQFARQTSDSIRQSLVLYKAAVARAPSFALGYVGIAEAEYALLTITVESPDVAVPHVRQALARALEIDPHLGEARGLLASVIYWRDWNWPAAEHQYRLAIAEGGQSQTHRRYGMDLVMRGRFEEGMAHLQTALELDPLGMSPRMSLVMALYFQRKYAEARHALDEVLVTNPDFLAGHALRGLVAMMQRDCATADAEAGWTAKRFPSPLADFEAALASGCHGNMTSARESLVRMASAKAFASPYQIALGYALIHDDRMALAYIEKSAAMREGQATYLKVEPIFDSLRAQPRFIALEKQMGLT